MSINPAEIMDLMLYHTCGRYFDKDGNKVFIYDLHCKTLEITAKYVPLSDDLDNPQYSYEILDYKLY